MDNGRRLVVFEARMLPVAVVVVELLGPGPLAGLAAPCEVALVLVVLVAVEAGVVVAVPGDLPLCADWRVAADELAPTGSCAAFGFVIGRGWVVLVTEGDVGLAEVLAAVAVAGVVVEGRGFFELVLARVVVVLVAAVGLGARLFSWACKLAFVTAEGAGLRAGGAACALLVVAETLLGNGFLFDAAALAAVDAVVLVFFT